jgi:hypothetical protein
MPYSPRRLVIAAPAGIFLIACLAGPPGAQVNPSPARDYFQQPSVIAKPADFARAVIYGTGGYYATSVAVGDLNGDGKPDLAVANSCQTGTGGGSNCNAGGDVSVLLGNGDGTFQPAVAYSSGGTAASSIAVADVNGDGHPDLIVANQCISATDCSNGTVGVLLGNGDGTFRAPVTYVAGYGADSVAVADLNGDGHPDLIVADGCFTANSCNTGGVSVLIGNGNGTFQTVVTSSSGGQNAVSVAVRDLNNDGFTDVVIVNQCFSKSNCKNGGVAVLLGNGNGTLRAASSYSSGGYSALSVAIADVNHDGQPDLVATSLCSDGSNCVNGVVGVLLGRGDGTFKPPSTYSTNGYGASSVAAADMNGDGIPDLVVDNICKTSTSCTNGGIALFAGNGDGTFQSPLVYSSSGNHATSVTVADLNGDSKADIVTTDYCTTKSNCVGLAAVLLNSSLLKTTTTLASSPNPSAAGQAVTFTATVTSASLVPDGETVTFYHGTVVLGTGATTEGVARLTTSFSKDGSLTIKATYPGDTFHKTSSGKVTQVVAD